MCIVNRKFVNTVYMRTSNTSVHPYIFIVFIVFLPVSRPNIHVDIMINSLSIQGPAIPGHPWLATFLTTVIITVDLTTLASGANWQPTNTPWLLNRILVLTTFHCLNSYYLLCLVRQWYQQTFTSMGLVTSKNGGSYQRDLGKKCSKWSKCMVGFPSCDSVIEKNQTSWRDKQA